jgi:hypothetical protein
LTNEKDQLESSFVVLILKINLKILLDITRCIIIIELIGSKQGRKEIGKMLKVMD